MKTSILAFNPGHDGAVALISEGTLEFCIESEKDSEARHQPCSATALFLALQRMTSLPDIFAVGGWENGPFEPPFGSGYHGCEERLAKRSIFNFVGSKLELFESTHERSHLFGSYGMSPFPQGQPCYALVWEGQTGSFYEIDRGMRILEFPQVLANPGYKYALLFEIADPRKSFGSWNHESAGKLMALVAYSKRGSISAEEDWIIRKVLDEAHPPRTDKAEFRSSPFCDCGVTDGGFLELAGKFSDSMFDRFYRYAKTNLTKRLPLLIGGGCGLNCEWNTRWKECGLFEDVFVPPVTNDSGSAIGTGIEAQYYRTGSAKIRWDVYCGADFVDDAVARRPSGRSLDYGELARDLVNGCVVAWVQGRYEIGPRALGHRSLLAAPFAASTRDRLNQIKMREPYRPVAPVCLEEDAEELFGLKASSPYMLEFQKVRTDCLQAVTHVDGSARVQTVNRTQNSGIYELLLAFKRLTGYGVLCNTSLNYPGRGFINRSRDLFRYVNDRKIEIAVVNGVVYRRALREQRSAPNI